MRAISYRGTVTETSDDPEIELPAPLSALLECSADRERRVLDKILTDGHDQGWVLAGCDAAVLAPSPAQAAAFFKRAGERPPTKPTVADTWAETMPPAQPVPEERSIWAILTQRCDLVRSFAQEPLVEVAPVVELAHSEAVAAKTNSPRLIYLTDLPDAGTLAVDLRRRAAIPKHALSAIAATPVIDNERAHKRFRLRLGQRYWRDPVPDDLVDTLQRPLIEAVKKSTARIARFESFTMWLGMRTEQGKVVVVAVAAEDSHANAEDDWNEVLKLLHKREPDAAALIAPDESGVYAVDDISLGTWLDSFKFDFDEITYSRRAGDAHAEPPV